jgi:hypothetical protein
MERPSQISEEEKKTAASQRRSLHSTPARHAETGAIAASGGTPLFRARGDGAPSSLRTACHASQVGHRKPAIKDRPSKLHHQ